MSMGVRRYSLVLNSRKRSSDAGTRRIRANSTSVGRKPILHLKPSAIRAVVGTTAGTIISADKDEEPSILDPVEIMEEPTEIQTPMQIYPTTQGRYIWSTWDWMVTSLGFTFNASTIVRCPFLCAEYGGVAFLLMYIIVVTFCAIPCCYLEAIVGQFTRSGSLAAWKISPLFKGLGFCFLLLNFMTTFLDNVMTTWSINYLVTIGRSVFGQHDFAWMACQEPWNSNNCVPFDSIRRRGPSSSDSNAEYFRGYVLNQQNPTITYGFESVQFPGIEVALTLAGVTIAVFILAAEVGSKGLSRISILLFGFSSSFIWLLFIRCVSLPGGSDGVAEFLGPKWGQLANFEAWLHAACLACTTCGVGLGIHLSQASFNQFSTPILPFVLIPIGVSTLYNIFATVIIFSLFGFSAKITTRSIKNVIQIHPLFVFEYIPITLPYDISFPTHFYLTAFFLTILFTAIMGSIVRLVNLRLCFEEVYRDSFFWKFRYKWSAMAVLILVSYALNLPLISNASLHWIALHQLSIDDISQSFLILLELIVIAWIVGAKTINEAHICCTGKHVQLYFIILWKFVIPPFLLILLVKPISFTIYFNEALPFWTSAVGYSVVLIMIGIVALTATYTFVTCKATDSKKLKLLLLISPDFEHREILNSKDGVRAHLPHYRSLGTTTLRFIKSNFLNLAEEDTDGEFFSQTADSDENGEEFAEVIDSPKVMPNDKRLKHQMAKVVSDSQLIDFVRRKLTVGKGLPTVVEVDEDVPRTSK